MRQIHACLFILWLFSLLFFKTLSFADSRYCLTCITTMNIMFFWCDCNICDRYLSEWDRGGIQKVCVKSRHSYYSHQSKCKYISEFMILCYYHILGVVPISNRKGDIDFNYVTAKKHKTLSASNIQNLFIKQLQQT